MNRRSTDLFFVLTCFLSAILYAVFVLLNVLRFYSLNPLLIGVGINERLFRAVVQGTNVCNLPFHSPNAIVEYLLMPFSFIESYFFTLIFWVLNKFIPSLTYADILLIVQPLFFIATAIIIYKFSFFIIKNRWLSFCICTSYLMSQLVFIGSTIGFTLTCVALPFLMLELFFVFSKNTKQALFFLILVNSVKADLIISNIIFAIVLFAFFRDLRKMAKIILAVSCVWLLVLFLFVLPRADLAFLFSDSYGATFKDALRYLLSYPLGPFNFVLRQLPSLFMVYIIHNLLLPFFSPQLLLPLFGLLPVLVFRNDTTAIFSSLSFVYASVIFAVKYLSERHNNNKFKIILGVLLICTASLSHYLYHFTFIDRSVGIIPFSRGFSMNEYMPTERNKLGLKIIQSIPKTSSCFTIKPLAERLGHLKALGIYNITPFENYEWDYCLFSMRNLEFAGWKFNYANYVVTIRSILLSGHFKVEVYKDGWLLLKRAGREFINTNDINRVLTDLNT